MEAFDTDDHGVDLVIGRDGVRTWKDVDDLSALVTSGRMSGEDVLGVLHAAAAVTALLDRDEPLVGPMGRLDTSNRMMSRRSSADWAPQPLPSAHDR